MAGARKRTLMRIINMEPNPCDRPGALLCACIVAHHPDHFRQLCAHGEIETLSCRQLPKKPLVVRVLELSRGRERSYRRARDRPERWIVPPEHDPRRYDSAWSLAVTIVDLSLNRETRSRIVASLVVPDVTTTVRPDRSLNDRTGEPFSPAAWCRRRK